jgi:hypothetical protein
MEMSDFFITGTRRGLGQALSVFYDTVDTLEECDVFINCKHDGFQQVELLYKAAELNKRIINIGSRASDGILQNKSRFSYAVQKSALDKANEQLYYQGVDTTIIRFGRFDSPRVDHGTKLKMSVEYCVSVVSWVVKQPYRVKELTVGPPVVR